MTGKGPHNELEAPGHPIRRMNEAKEQRREQWQAEKAQRNIEKARQSRAKRREKRSFDAQGRAMDRKGVPQSEQYFIVGRHWDPNQSNHTKLQPRII